MSNTFKVMDGSFGEDGLESKWAVFKADSVKSCADWMIEQIKQAKNKLELSLIAVRWVEEHTDPDDNYAAVWDEVPYPHARSFDLPEVMTALRQREAELRPA